MIPKKFSGLVHAKKKDNVKAANSTAQHNKQPGKSLMVGTLLPDSVAIDVRGSILTNYNIVENMDPLVMELLEAERNSQYSEKGDAGGIFNGTVMGDLLLTDRLFDGHSSLTQAAKSMRLIVDLLKMDRLMDGTSNSPPVHTEVKKQEPRRNIFTKHEMMSAAERSSILSTEKIFADILAVDTMISNEQKDKTHSQYMNLMQDLLAVDEMIDNVEQQNLENSLKLANPGGNSQEGCDAVEPRRSIFSPK